MIDASLITAIVAIIASVSAVVLAWRKAPAETRQADADAADQIREAALALLEPMQKRIDELERARERDKVRLGEHERRISELECELRDERSAKAEVVDGAQRLVHQVESLGANPVYRPPKRGAGELKMP